MVPLCVLIVMEGHIAMGVGGFGRMQHVKLITMKYADESENERRLRESHSFHLLQS
jgi:hypothetical protein